MLKYLRIISQEMIFTQRIENFMKMKLITLIIIFSSISSSLSMGMFLDTMNMFTDSVDLTELENISSMWNELSPIFSEITNSNVSFGKQTALQEAWQTSETCKEQMGFLLKGIQNGDLWALKMLDASAKLEPGLFHGNHFLFGNYDECLEVKYAYLYDGNLDATIKGKYCTAAAIYSGSRGNFASKNNHSNRQVQLLLQSSVGMCVPSGCSVQDLQNISNSISETYSLPVSIRFIDGYCTTEDIEMIIPSRSIYSLIVFAFVGLLLALGTLADIFNLPGNNAILKCFSIYTNGKKLFTLKSREDSLKSLNGLRVLSMMLIVLAHRFIAASTVPAVNKIFIDRWLNYWYNYFCIGLGFVVDTFFTISGLLIVYLYKRATAKGNNPNWIIFILHRILRLTPSLAMLILFYSTLMPLFEPAWSPVLESVFGEACRKKWWTTLLYIQNYWNPNDMCAVQTWYLAIDTQLYVISPVLLIMLTKFPRSTIISLFLLAFISMAAAFEVTWTNLLDATYLNQGIDEYKYLYTPTHIRITPWLLGAIIGYFIAKYKHRSFPMCKMLVCFLWITSLTVLIFVLLFQKFYHDHEYNVLASSLFNTFSRPLWGAAICVIILLCVFEHGGVINWLLSSPIFTVMIRINYSIYLIHVLVTSLILTNTRTTTYLSVFSIIHETLGDYCIILVIATFWTLAFESPIIALEKIIFSRGKCGRDNLDNKNNDVNGSCETVIVK